MVGIVMKQKVWTILVLGILLFTCIQCYAEETATEQLRPAINEITHLLADDSLQGDENAVVRRQKIMEIISIHFDFRIMSQMILRKGWKKLTSEQKDEFTLLMTNLLEHAYIGRLEEYPGGEVRFLDERIRRNGSADVSTVITFEGKDVIVHYIMIYLKDRWKVYEVKIETFSLIATYSEQFQPILRKKGYAGLVEVIQEKINYLNKEVVE